MRSEIDKKKKKTKRIMVFFSYKEREKKGEKKYH